MTLVTVAAVIVVLLATAVSQLPAAGAGAVLHPWRSGVQMPPPEGCQAASFAGRDVRLEGWTCAATVQPRRGTLVYLHGIADNRTSGVNIIRRFTALGFDVVAYDSRAHGDSTGDPCTYGYFEKDDLRLVLDQLNASNVVLLGTSLGAAVALQAGHDSRVRAIVSVEAFSDLRSVAAERAPVFFTRASIDASLALAETQAQFKVDQASPVAAAPFITAPVLVIHGEDDVETSPDHARRIFAALTGPKRLILVPGAGHNQSLGGEVWADIDRWIDKAVPPMRTRQNE